jgi:hypothetical protein
MKVNIGKYVSYYGIHGVVKPLRRIFGDTFAEKMIKFLRGSLFDHLLRWADSKSKRIEEVIIHDYDTWNLDHTLALVIAPALKKFREFDCGYHVIGNEDVSEELHTSENYGYHTTDEEDEKRSAKWNYVLDEMVWAFDTIIGEDNDEMNYTTEEEKARQERVANGLRLFAKYYRALWN